MVGGEEGEKVDEEEGGSEGGEAGAERDVEGVLEKGVHEGEEVTFGGGFFALDIDSKVLIINAVMNLRMIVPLAMTGLICGGVFLVGCGSRPSQSGSVSTPRPYVPKLSERQYLAKALLADSRFKLANFHVSGKIDSATALQNLQQTAAGSSAARSAYGKAPGGRTMLDPRMLRAMRTLMNSGYTVRVTELAGGSHSSNSRHYLGVAIDIDYVNGVKVGSSNPHYRSFLQRCREMGATEVLGPGDRGHSTHIHVAWPRTDG